MADGENGGPQAPVLEKVLNIESLGTTLDRIPDDRRSEAVSSLLQSLPDSETAQAVGDAFSSLSANAQEATASEVFDRLDTPQKTVQVVQGMDSLPAPKLEEAVGAALQRLPSPQLEAAASTAMGQLPAAAQQRVIGGLSTPDAATNRWLWKCVVGSLVAVIIIFGVLSFVLIYQGKHAEATLALATTALGGIVGAPLR
jgi:hypothetical protein